MYTMSSSVSFLLNTVHTNEPTSRSLSCPAAILSTCSPYTGAVTDPIASITCVRGNGVNSQVAGQRH